jgi:hypothetical protein
MPYLVLRGAIMLITKPDGKMLVVHTGDVKAIVFTCDNCGAVAEQDGLCDDCKKLGLLDPPRKPDSR